MITNFSEQLWIDFDIEIAVFLENLVSWVRYNASKDKIEHRNFHEGRYWSYDTYKELSKRFPGWSDQVIRRIIKRAIDADLVIIGHFNKKKYDNTNWYSLSDKALKYFPQLHELFSYSLVEIDNTLVEIDKPIPEDLNSLSKNTNNSSSSGKSDYSSNHKKGHLEGLEDVDGTGFAPKSDYCDNQIENNSILTKSSQKGDNVTQQGKLSKSGKVELMALIDIYREEFPNNPQPHKTLISTSLEKVLRTLIKRWPEADPKHRSISLDAFRQYLNALKTLSPKFALQEYETASGTRKKNGLETFARWNTLVKFLENQYS